MTELKKTDSATFIEPIAEEPRMPGHESEMDRKPEWQPRYPGSGRMKGKVAIVTGAARPRTGTRGGPTRAAQGSSAAKCIM